jgi:hypothetical protein
MRGRLRASTTTAAAKNSNPTGPMGGPCISTVADSASRIDPLNGAPARRTATAAAKTATAQPIAPMVTAMSSDTGSSSRRRCDTYACSDATA